MPPFSGFKIRWLGVFGRFGVWTFLSLVALFVVACAGPATLSNVPGPESDPGRKIYLSRCAKCHKFYDPSKYSDQEWGMWMQKMKKKAKLSDEQEALLSSYINANLREGRSH